jgi:hypothetical protein
MVGVKTVPRKSLQVEAIVTILGAESLLTIRAVRIRFSGLLVSKPKALLTKDLFEEEIGLIVSMVKGVSDLVLVLLKVLLVFIFFDQIVDFV